MLSLERLPGRRDRRNVLGQEAVARAVPGHDAERVTRPIGDAEAGAGRPPRVRDRLRSRHGPARVAVGLERDDATPACRDDEARAGRERRVLVGAEQALGAIRPHEPRPALGDDEELTGRGQPDERGLRLLRAGHAVANPVADCPAGRRECGGNERGDHGECDQRPEPARAAHRLPLGVRGLHDGPGAALSLELVGDRSGQQRRADVAGGHSGSSTSTTPWSASRPRRSREFTVPRGSSSMRAISPGEYSRT